MVPEGWKKEPLSDVTAVIDCKHRTPVYVEEGIPLVSPGTIKWGALDLVSPVKRVSKDEYESLMDHCTVDIGDLVMSRNQSVGIASHVETDEPFVLGQDTVLIKPQKVDGKFVFYKLQSEVVQRSIIKLAGGSTFSRINLADIRKLKLSLPPLTEQKKIALILSAWDKAITTTEQLLANRQQQKKALMQQLLTGKKRLLDKSGVRFSGKWPERLLGNVSKITTGSSNRQDSHMNGAYTFFDRSEDIRTSDSYLFDCEAVIVPGEGQDFIPKYYVGKFDLHQRAYVIMDFPECHGKFLFYAIHYFRSHFLSQAVGSTVKSLRLPMFQKMKLSLPTI
ncbi:MAG: type I restriction enzyme S subunit, partial [Candidatus Azotimanducaceae bacterium]